MRRLSNVEIAKYVFEKMEKKSYDVEYDKILQMVDDSIEYNDDYEKDENGEIAKDMSEEEIQELKNKMLNGTVEYYDSINERKNEEGLD